ncbi:hypothetical protein BSFA1_65320 (plasmid) [Burkholderia sp. SFA1]|nr:hypothetical protein BSFA1_65320 [Burkholderia sp. SFA1]
MIEPARGIAAPRAIDHAAVVETEEERVTVLRVRLLVHALRFLPRETQTLVFEQQRARGQIGESEDAPAMYGRGADSDSTHGVADRSEDVWYLREGVRIAMMWPS